MPELALISLGSNLGDRKLHLDFAVAALSNTPGVTVRAVSSYHETPPVGGPGGQGAFLNAAAALETTLEPEPLLDLLNDVEDQFGRVRSVRWGERTLDLDLLLYGDRVLQTPRLTLPHPRMAVRRFVLAPLAQIAHAAVDPMTGWTVVELLANLDRRPSVVAIQGADEVVFESIYQSLCSALRMAFAYDMTWWVAPDTINDPDPLVRLGGQIIGRSWAAAEGSRRVEGEPSIWLAIEFCLPLDHAAWSRMLRERTAQNRPMSPIILRRDRWLDRHLSERPSSRAAWLPFIPRRGRVFDSEAVDRNAEAVPRPTFAVILGGAAPTDFARGSWPVPLLFPGSTDPNAVAAEVVAACLATRAG